MAKVVSRCPGLVESLVYVYKERVRAQERVLISKSFKVFEPQNPPASLVNALLREGRHATSPNGSQTKASLTIGVVLCRMR
jgi:hypothetical protein